APVEEHRDQDRHPRVLVGEDRLAGRLGVTDVVAQLHRGQRLPRRDLAPHGRPLVQEPDLLLWVLAALDEEPDEGAGGDDDQGHHRGDPGRVDVSDRDHGTMLCERARQPRNRSKGGSSMPASSSVLATTAMAPEASTAPAPSHGSDPSRATAPFRSMPAGATSSTSSQASGTATGALGRARSDQGATA